MDLGQNRFGGQGMAKRTVGRIGVWIILGLLFVGLIGFGATNLSGTIRSIGTAGSKSIPVQSYSSALTQQIDAFSAQIGTPLTFSQAQAIGLDRSVLQQVVTTAVLDNEAQKLGLSVGDARVRDRVISIPAFQGLSGDFDREAYRFSLDRNGLTEATFEADLRDEIARSLLQAAVIAGTPEPAAYADAMVAYIGQRRSLIWAPVTTDVLTAPLPAPTADQIAAQYAATPEAYTLPEVRRITYVWLAPDDIQTEVTVDDQAVRDLYDSRIADYVQPERRLVERLVYPDVAAAEAALARVTSGEADFDRLVVDRGLALADVDLGDVALDDLGAASEAVFAARPGDVVGPLDTSLGPALFRMNAVLSAQEIPFDVAEPDLRAELARDRARRVIADEAERITDLMASGRTLEDVAEQTGMALGTLDWTPGSADGIAAYDTFREAAAAAEIDAFPELTDLSDGGVFALRLDAVTPPALQPLEDVRDSVAADALATAERAAVMAEADRVAAALNDRSLPVVPAGGAPDTTLPRLDWQAEPGIVRRDFIAGTPEGFVAAVFGMEPGTAQVVTDATGRIVVVLLDAIAPVDPADPTMIAERQAIAERAGSGISQDIYAAFTTAVSSRTEIALDQAAIAAVNAQFR